MRRNVPTTIISSSSSLASSLQQRQRRCLFTTTTTSLQQQQQQQQLLQMIVPSKQKQYQKMIYQSQKFVPGRTRISTTTTRSTSSSSSTSSTAAVDRSSASIQQSSSSTTPITTTTTSSAGTSSASTTADTVAASSIKTTPTSAASSSSSFPSSSSIKTKAELDNYLLKAQTEMKRYDEARRKFAKNRSTASPFTSLSSFLQVITLLGVVIAFISTPLIAKKMAKDEEFRSKYIHILDFMYRIIGYDIEKLLKPEPNDGYTREEVHAGIVLAHKELYKRAINGEFSEEKLKILEKKLIEYEEQDKLHNSSSNSRSWMSSLKDDDDDEDKRQQQQQEQEHHGTGYVPKGFDSKKWGAIHPGLEKGENPFEDTD